MTHDENNNGAPDEPKPETPDTESVDDAAEASAEATASDTDAAPEAAAEPEAAAAPEAAPVRGETVGEAASLIVGVTPSADEYGHHVAGRDTMSDDQLRAMGSEPDTTPSAALALTFVGLIIALIVSGVAVAEIFQAVTRQLTAESFESADPRLAEVEEAARAYTETYGEVGEGTYRVPVEVGVQMLIDNPSLLETHPMGVPEEVEGAAEGETRLNTLLAPPATAAAEAGEPAAPADALAPAPAADPVVIAAPGRGQ